MSELLQAAKAVIERWDNYSTIMDGQVIYDLRAAVERAENPPAAIQDWYREHWESMEFKSRAWLSWEVWQAAQQAERECIRARAKIAAEKTFKAGGYYVGPQHYLIEQFVDALLEDGDATAK